MTMAAGRALEAFWNAPYRPLFFASYASALCTVAWWPLGVAVGLPGPACTPEVLWHIHELIFGFAGAAIGGYLLTALPGWTGRPPVQGTSLKWLLGFWVSARIAIALTCDFVPVLPIALNAGYFLLLATIIGSQLFSAKAYRKLWFLCAVAGLGLCEAVFLWSFGAGLPWVNLNMVHGILTGLVMLMVSIAMCAIPAFTTNWMLQTGQLNNLTQCSEFNIFLARVGLISSVFAQLFEWTTTASLAMITAALALIWEMRKWRTPQVLCNPLLAALHLSFLWLSIGLLVTGVSGLVPTLYPTSVALHAITIGGMSGLIMAISGRAAAHTDTGGMRANFGFITGVVLVWLATAIRLAVPIFPDLQVELAAAAVWCIGWVAFIIGFLPALTGPIRRPVLSGQRFVVSKTSNLALPRE
ncbi:NnrS family protein [uncultured Ruegeria sp.]|uniref:NnrS family protein n=1 Tax=uncultured Ruegeria sp. TaxID=259304 RepID=UPI0026052BA3|nr:NnrS family protein [uncultured Ruegeria sp.]